MSSVNVRCPQAQQKCVEVLEYLKNLNSNIICIQDSHWIDKDYKRIYQLWNNPVFINGSATNARGVAILIKNNFEYKILNCYKDNCITLDIKFSKDISVRIINIYAPNNDDPNFFQDIEKKVAQNECAYVLICGDFNLVLDKEMDSLNYKHINNPRSRKFLLNMIRHI